MGNRADEYGTDVEIYRKPLTTTIHADTPTDAPEQLLDLLDQLDQLGLERRTAGPIYVWHVVPEHLDADEQKRLASRAIPTLIVAGYKVNCTPDVFDEAAYQQAVHEIRSGHTRPVAQPTAAPAASTPAPPPRRAR
ncbi:hypothetical protein LKL35_12510 [Streptomyces sp. ET3-23]|uniref:hypothetical protein n=1 Tax=Streptomyces sp. ET3-23 TaxID=2885643 RepID=UPI001D104549|nr:hypothetical protein [Streptomyces sp. ET3-23]MCC2276230.1 hypothetical protein [Streptomyces sp. ET3-23]